jgi:hypothetical protein
MSHSSTQPGLLARRDRADAIRQVATFSTAFGKPASPNVFGKGLAAQPLHAKKTRSTTTPAQVARLAG